MHEVEKARQALARKLCHVVTGCSFQGNVIVYSTVFEILAMTEQLLIRGKLLAIHPALVVINKRRTGTYTSSETKKENKVLRTALKQCQNEAEGYRSDPELWELVGVLRALIHVLGIAPGRTALLGQERVSLLSFFARVFLEQARTVLVEGEVPALLVA